MGLPDNDDSFAGYGNDDGRGGRYGDNGPYGGNGDDPNGNNNARFRNYRNRDRLDLNSNLAAGSLSNKDQLNKLNIEKQVELKTTKTMVPRREIRKYQNEPYSEKKIRDLGGC